MSKKRIESKREREKIREVMRFSGPRTILYHPVMAVCHMVESNKEKTEMEKGNEN